jgi:RHS repeat-associated protein
VKDGRLISSYFFILTTPISPFDPVSTLGTQRTLVPHLEGFIMADRALLRRWFTWVRRWWLGHFAPLRRPIVRQTRPTLMILEERNSPTSVGSGSLLETVPPRSHQPNGVIRSAFDDSRNFFNVGGATASGNIQIFFPSSPAQKTDSLTATPPPQAETSLIPQSRSSEQLAALDSVYSQASVRSAHRPRRQDNNVPNPQAPSSGGGSIGGVSTPNAAGGGSGSGSSGAGPGITNANQFLSAYLGMIGSAHMPGMAPAVAMSTASADHPIANNGATAAQAGTAVALATPSVEQASRPSSESAVLPARPSTVSHPLPPKHHHGNDPLYVLDMNTGETLPANVTLSSFSSWGENLLAQVSGGSVMNYSWDTGQAPDLTNIVQNGPNLQGTWASFTGAARTDTITVTENGQLSQTMTFLVAGTDSPGYSSSRPTSSATWPSVLSPDQLTAAQATQSGGSYASLGLADGSVQTSFAMPSYNPNVEPVGLMYNSTTANAEPIFLAHYQLPTGQAVPATITAQLTFNGSAGSQVVYDTSNLNPGDWVQIALQGNATGLSSGRYPWQIAITNGTTTTYSGNVDIVNQASSPYGAGWSLSNVEQLVPVSGSGVILVQPDGTSLWFANGQQSGTFVTPASDFSTLVQNLDGTYTRTLTDGTAIHFDSTGRQTSTVDRDGNTTTFGYTSGLLTTITDMNNQVTTLTYTGGKLTSITDPASRSATLAYTGNQLTSITDPASDVWGYAYDTSNDLTTLTDPNNHATTFSYNFADRVATVTQADLTTEQLTAEQMNGLAAPGTGTANNPATAMLLAAGDQASFTDPNNQVWTIGLDWLGFGLDTADIDPIGDASLNYLDANGLAWMSSDALGRRTREFFDDSGNATKIVNPDDSYVQYTYNQFSEPTQYTNELGKVTTYTYNTKGDLTQETNALNYTTTYSYNAAGLVTSMTNARNYTWTTTYDSLNRKTGETDPLTHTQSWTYDSASNLTQYTDQNGHVSTFAHDPMGRMTSETLPDSTGVTSTYTFTYDKVGNQTSEIIPITSTQSTTTYDTYDAMNRLSTEKDALGNVTTHTYDNNGNQVGVIDPLGNETTYTYDAANRETGETIPLSGSGQTQVSATTTFGYDAAGEQTSKKDALGDLWQYTYNNRGWMSSATDPSNDLTTYGYDSVGDQTSVTQSFGSTTYTVTTTYDAIGEKTQVTCPPPNNLTAGSISGSITGTLSGSWSGTNGGPLSGSFSGSFSGTVSGPGGVPEGTITGSISGTASGSIQQNGILSASYSGSGTAALSRGLTGSVQVTISGGFGDDTLGARNGGSLSGSLSATISGSIDGSGNVSGSLSGSSSLGIGSGESSGSSSGTVTGTASPTTTYTYDSVGNLLSQNGPGGCDGAGGCSCGGSGSMTYGYNAANQQTSMSDGANDTTTYAYDGVGNQTQVTDALNHTTSYSFDSQNRPLSVTNPLTGTTSYTYNLAGWKTSETDPDNNVTQYGYNAAGELTSEADPLTYQKTFSYDQAGRLTGQTDENGQQTQYSYNEAGWKTGETWLNSLNQPIYQATYTYDNAGRLTSEQDANSLYSYTYNSSGQLTQTAVTYPGVSSSPLATLSYGYDGFDNRTSLTDSLGGSLTYSYNGEHELTGETFALNGTRGPQLTLSYDTQERLTGITRTNGLMGDTITSGYSYDQANRLTNLTYTDTTKTVTLASYTYGYNTASQVTSYQDNNTSLTYGYDTTNQLTSASGTLNGSSYSASWTYDANGNRNMTGYQMGTGNELLNDGTFTYTYDKNGNTLTKTNTATGDQWTYSWDYHNRMAEAVEKTSGGTVENDEKYTYDVEGRLIGVNVNGTQQRWTVFDGANPYMDFNGAGTAVTERYVTNPESYGTLYARVSGTGTANWYVTDLLGSVRAVVDTSGSTLDTIVYDPWGNIVSESNAANGDRFKYDGGQYDSIQQMYLFTARWDNPQDGRWESQDPLGLKPDSDSYRYVKNNPILFEDSSGLSVYADVLMASSKPRITGTTIGVNCYICRVYGLTDSLIPLRGSVTGGVKFAKAVAKAKTQMILAALNNNAAGFSAGCTALDNAYITYW